MFEFLGSLASAGVNYFTGSQNRDQQMQIAQMNIQQQQDMARHGLGYRIEDAVAHGLSPLIGAGVTPGSFSPVSVNSTDFGSMGQDVGRAVKALGDIKEREMQDQQKVRDMAIEHGELENAMLKADLVSKVRREAQQLGPAMPPNWQSMVSGGPSRSPGGVALSEDKMKQKEEGYPTVRGLRFAGIPLKTWPGRASAQDVQNEYGDIVEDFAGGANLVLDILHTMGSAVEPLAKWNAWQEIRDGSGNRSRWSRAQRTLVGR